MANAHRFAVKREAVMETGGRFTVTRTAVTANRDRFHPLLPPRLQP